MKALLEYRWLAVIGINLVLAVCEIFELLLHCYAHIIHQSHLSSPLSSIHAESVIHQMLAKQRNSAFTIHHTWQLICKATTLFSQRSPNHPDPLYQPHLPDHFHPHRQTTLHVSSNNPWNLWGVKFDAAIYACSNLNVNLEIDSCLEGVKDAFGI